MLKVHLRAGSVAEPEASSSPMVPAPAGTRLVREARRFCGGAASLSPFIALLALGVSFSQLNEARRTTRLRPISEILGQSTQITMWMANYPEVAAYFQADLFDRSWTANSDGHGSVAALAEADPATRRRVQVVCEVLADFFETTYTQRHAFDPVEWAAWWNYLEDITAESPALRAYFARRDRWYTVDEALDRALATAPTARRKS